MFRHYTLMEYFHPQAYNMHMKKTKLPLLGGITPEQFLAEYWQKKPLLIRQAIPDFQAFIDKQALAELAKRDDVESRLVSCIDQHWELQRGPFERLPKEKSDWTMLVQGVNLHNDQADQLLRQFRFIPDTRLDDLMISYAVDGGGVGPHFDSYDVFLLQAHGQRRWRISTQKKLDLIEGLPLKILSNFKAEQEFVLEPGDMLYLPPHCAHDGVAIGECMTYSIGFRAYPFQELASAFMGFMSDSIDLPGRYADPELKYSDNPAEISKAMLEQVNEEFQKIQFSKHDVLLFLGEYLSDPKSHVFFETPQPCLSPPKFEQKARKLGVKLNRKTIMLYQGKQVFVNGESFNVNAEDKIGLTQLANQRFLNPEQMAGVSEDVMEALCVWYEDGWLHLA